VKPIRSYRNFLDAIGRKPPGRVHTLKAPGSIEICWRRGHGYVAHRHVEPTRPALPREGRRFDDWRRRRDGQRLLED